MEAWHRSNKKKRPSFSDGGSLKDLNQRHTNQLNEGFNMNANEQIIRETCAAAEGRALDTEKFVSAFSEDGYMWDMASGTKFRGKGIGDCIAALASAFPDVHREILKVHVAGDVVIVELAIRGTHQGELKLPSGTIAPTGKKIDFPSCDVFHLENGKIKSFHCYNEAALMLQQLGVGPS
jgi:predicted ester cyclase